MSQVHPFRLLRWIRLLTLYFCIGKIDTLKHVKKDVMEMGKGTECGIGFERFNDLKVGDVIEVFVMERVAVTAERKSAVAICPS